MSILADILQQKRVEIDAAQLQCSEDALLKLALDSEEPRGFRRALRQHQGPAIIAEIKRASPSRGPIRPELDPAATGKEYAAAGAACISVLTDEKFFAGHLGFLRDVRRAAPQCPILRKDFTIDRYQVWESRAAGADAILLIVAALSDFQLKELHRAAGIVHLDVLIEIHSSDELDRVIKLILEDCFDRLENRVRSSGVPVLGINSRDLKTFTKDPKLFEQLVAELPGKLAAVGLEKLLPELTLIAESGLKTGQDIAALQKKGLHGFLIGESLVVQGQPGENLRSLIQDARNAKD